MIDVTQPSETSPAPALDPVQVNRIASALQRYRVMAWITGVWLMFLLAEITYKYAILGADETGPDWLKFVPVVHGWAYFIYLGTTIDLATKVRWSAKSTLLTAIAGTIPFLSFYFEHRNAQQVKTDFALK